MDQQELRFEQEKLDENHLQREQQVLLVDLMAQVIVAVYREQQGENHDQLK